MAITLYGSGNALIKSTSFANGTRTSYPSSATNATINVLWTVSVTKINNTSSFNVKGILQNWQANNGGATWFVRINGGSWISGGTHVYAPGVTYCLNDNIQAYIPASSINAGTVTIDVGWASSQGKPANIWNPNSTDSSTEMYYQSYSQLVVDEISG
jgi:hypothetical protein